MRFPLQVYPQNHTQTGLLLLIGAIYYQLGNYEQCIAFNDRCIILDPHMAEAHANLANALQQMGNFDMAIIYYQVSSQLLSLWCRLAVHFSRTLIWLLCPPQSALRLKPTFTDAYNNMASALVQKGLIPAALQCYQSALQINPNLVRSGGLATFVTSASPGKRVSILACMPAYI